MPQSVSRVDAVGLDPAVADFLLSGEDGRDGDADAKDVIATRTRVLALNRRAASTGGQRIGTVTTMRDSTELASMQAQLSSHKSVTDTLRAQTHEFSNQLHTISGLVQLGEYDAVRDLVGTLTRRRAEISDAVTQRISDPAVAALLIAKTSLAAENARCRCGSPTNRIWVRWSPRWPPTSSPWWATSSTMPSMSRKARRRRRSS